ncbi:MAG: response regulator [Syntrophomonadaceae bacterium]|nr:response regulator [Syntrophomonadaceae bacterium]
MKNIKVLLADDNENMRASIRKLLELDKSIDIVAEAATGREVIQQIEVMEPEVVIMDISMPEMDGLEATHYISQYYPQVFVIIISVYDEIQNFKKAMMAGAKEYLVKPLSPDDLNTTIRRVAQLGRNNRRIPRHEAEAEEYYNNVRTKKVVTIFGPKGGVGRSTIISNLAVALARNKKQRAALIDLDIQFGDISVMMNINPRKTISELMQEGDMSNQELLEEYMYERNGVHILAAPNKPELAELVTVEGIEKIIKSCRDNYDFTFIDTPSFIDENILTALEMTDLVLLITTLDLPTIKNVKKGIEILKTLKLLSKTRLILNHSSQVAGIEVWDVERVLDLKVKGKIPSDSKLALSSLNQGTAIIKSNPKANISKAIINLLQLLEIEDL